MKILLTGGAGYIGSHVLLSILEKKYEAVVVDDLSTGHESLVPEDVRLIKCNINDKDKISNIVQKEKFDVLLHFAGFIRVEESVQNPVKYFKNNTENAITLFETCYKNNLRNIIFSSTAAAYGNPASNNSIKEDANLSPLNPYGQSKIDTEQYLIENSNKFNSVILRYFNVAGADPELRSGLISKEPTHLIKILSEIAVGKRDKIYLYGNDYNTDDGTPVRDYIHVSDLADIHIKTAEYLMEKKTSNIFNCGYGRGYSVLEVVNEANKITGNKIKYEFSERRPGDAEKLVSNIDKLSQTINWEPKFNDLNLIIKTAIEWEKKINEKNF